MRLEGIEVSSVGLIHRPLQAKGGGDMSSGGFSARAQSAAAHNTNSGAGQSTAQGSTGGGVAGAKK